MAQSKSASVDTVQEARTKARQRLIGAVVLLLVGIIGFPLVFETQPRPIPVDVTITIPRKDAAPALQTPAPRAAPAASAPLPVAASSGVAPREETAAAVSPPVSARPAATPTPTPTPTPKPSATPTPSAAPAAQNSAAPSAAAETPGRFVVQVGAFADAAAAQTVRARADKLGLKTYTQVAETAAGNRVRVRIGPFNNRETAEQAAAKAKAGGLSAVVLTL